MVISLEQRTPHARCRSPLTRPLEAKLTLCHLPTAKEILVITCSFLNIIEHRPFHQSKCVTFRFTAPLSVTDRSAEGLRWTIFVSLRLMGPKNRALRWPAGLSAHFRDRSTHLSPHTPPLTKLWPDCFIFRRSWEACFVEFVRCYIMGLLCFYCWALTVQATTQRWTETGCREEEGRVKALVPDSRNNPAVGLIGQLSCSLAPLQQHAKVFDLIIHINGSGRILSAPRGYQIPGQYTEHSGRPSSASD